MSLLFVLNSYTVCCSSEKPFSFHKLFGFSAFLCIWTLSNNLRFIFSHWGRLRDSYAAITEASNTHWCSRRRKHALRAGAWRLLNRMEMFLILLKYHIFSFSTALQRRQKIVTCFPEHKISKIYLDIQIQKVFTPPALKGIVHPKWKFCHHLLPLK